MITGKKERGLPQEKGAKRIHNAKLEGRGRMITHTHTHEDTYRGSC